MTKKNDDTTDETTTDPYDVPVPAEADEDLEPESNDVDGQIVFPDAEVDAERAGEFVAGKTDTLYEEGDPRNETWQNPADSRSDEQRAEDAENEDTSTDE